MLKWKKLAHSVTPADKISLYVPSIKIFSVFYLPKGVRSSAFISENVGRSVIVIITSFVHKTWIYIFPREGAQ